MLYLNCVAYFGFTLLGWPAWSRQRFFFQQTPGPVLFRCGFLMLLHGGFMAQTHRRRFLSRRMLIGIGAVLTLALSLVVLPFQVQAHTGKNNSCQLGNDAQHVIYVQFDN